MDTETARSLLEAEQTRLREIVGTGLGGDFGEAEQETASDVLSYDQHSADAAQETIDRQVELSLIESAEMELGEAAHALTKLEDGTYGVCEECGQPIPDERLEARPATRFDLEHQTLDQKRAGVATSRFDADSAPPTD